MTTTGSGDRVTRAGGDAATPTAPDGPAATTTATTPAAKTMAKTTAKTTAKTGSRATFADVPAPPMKAMAKLPGWQVLRSMRTAIYLLLLWVTLTLIPTFVPQAATNPTGVADWFRKYPELSRALNKLWFFDVFTAPWYSAVWASLLVVLVLCLVPRTRAFLRMWRRSTRVPGVANDLPRVAERADWVSSLEPDAARRSLRSALRRQRFRTSEANAAGQFVAEKGYGREGGSLLFHWSMLAIALWFLVSNALGFTGFAVLVEGQKWTEAPINIDRYRPPWFFERQLHPGFTMALDNFKVAFRPGGGNADFVARVTLQNPDGSARRTQDVRVNSPLTADGVKLYLNSFGWAVRAVVTDPATGKVVFDDWVQTNAGGPRNSWAGVAKIPSVRPQAGLEVFLLPTAVQISPDAATAAGDAFGSLPWAAKPGPPRADSPAVVVKEYRGNLGLDRPQDTGSLDRSLLGDAVAGGIVSVGNEKLTFDDGLQVAFPEIRHYVVFQVKRDPGLLFLLLAAGLILGGLIPSLYAYRRRVWVWVRPDPADPGRSLIAFGGIAYQRKDVFTDSFAHLAATLRSRSGSLADTSPTTSPTTFPTSGGEDTDAVNEQMPTAQTQGPPHAAEPGTDPATGDAPPVAASPAPTGDDGRSM